LEQFAQALIFKLSVRNTKCDLISDVITWRQNNKYLLSLLCRKVKIIHIYRVVGKQ